MDIDSQLRQFKDFLSLYNTITDKCFNSCVDGFFSRKVEDNEDFCVRNCVDKFANTNQLVMKTYVEVQSKINEKRMEEFTKQQEQLQQQNLEQQQTEANNLITQQSEEPPS